MCIKPCCKNIPKWLEWKLWIFVCAAMRFVYLLAASNGYWNKLYWIEVELLSEWGIYLKKKVVYCMLALILLLQNNSLIYFVQVFRSHCMAFIAFSSSFMVLVTVLVVVLILPLLTRSINNLVNGSPKIMFWPGNGSRQLCPISRWTLKEWTLLAKAAKG